VRASDPRGLFAQAYVKRVTHGVTTGRNHGQLGLGRLACREVARGLLIVLQILGWHEIAPSHGGTKAILELEA
jgi:hypothetical protein